jgi:hypothetical protein
LLALLNSSPQGSHDRLSDSVAHLSLGCAGGHLNANAQCAEMTLHASGNFLRQALANAVGYTAPRLSAVTRNSQVQLTDVNYRLHPK